MIPDTTSPSTPAGLVASVAGSGLGLSWTASTDDVLVKGYEIHRSTTSGFTPSSATLIAFTDTAAFADAPGDGTWYYRVVAVDTSGNASTASAQATATLTDNQPPTTPTEVSASQVNQPVALTWTPSSDDFGVALYRVYRSTSSSFAPSAATAVGTTTTAAYSETDVPFGTWYYRVVAEDAKGNQSPPSAAAAVLVGDRTPPTSPTLTTTANGQQVHLAWTGATDAVGVVGYKIYRSPTAGFALSDATLMTTSLVTTTAYDDPAGPGTWYYQVVAVDAAGNASVPAAERSTFIPDIEAPTAPTSISASLHGLQAVLSWVAAADNVAVSGYDVHRSAVAGFTPTAANLVGTAAGDATSYTENPPAGTWYYRVVAKDAAGHRTASDDTLLTLTDSTPPSAPTALTATAAGASVQLSWTAATDDFGVLSYQVHRSATAGFTRARRPCSAPRTPPASPTPPAPGPGTTGSSPSTTPAAPAPRPTRPVRP